MDGMEDFRRLVFGILDGGDPDEPDYLKIQKRHSESIAKWLQTGRKREDYRSGIDETLFDNILMPTNRLLYQLDPTTRLSVESVQDDSDIRPHFRDFWLLWLSISQPVGRLWQVGGSKSILTFSTRFVLSRALSLPTNRGAISCSSARASITTYTDAVPLLSSGIPYRSIGMGQKVYKGIYQYILVYTFVKSYTCIY